MPSQKNRGRDSFGFINIRHKGKLFKTSVGSRSYENMFGGLWSERNFTHTLGFIPIGYAHRPDLISNVFYDSPSSWWMICERNNIFDTFEQLKSGDRIYIPS